MPQDSFLETYFIKVESDFESDINNLQEFFMEQGLTQKRSSELTFSLKRAIYHIKRDKNKRLEIAKKVLPILKDKKKLEIEDLEKLMRLRPLLKQATGNEYLFFKSLKEKILKEIQLGAIPKAGPNILLRLALTPFFWKLNDYGVGQSAQVRLAYDLFVHYELDDYGTESDDGKTFIGETEQKDRIRFYIGAF